MVQPTRVILSGPSLLTYFGAPSDNMCAQATEATVGKPVLLQKIDSTGRNQLQLWQIGNDGLIYLYNHDIQPMFCLTFAGRAEDSAPLVLAFPNPSDDNQIWLPVCFQNLGASRNGTGFFLDDKYGSSSAGNQLQIYHANGNPSQRWLIQPPRSGSVRDGVKIPVLERKVL